MSRGSHRNDRHATRQYLARFVNQGMTRARFIDNLSQNGAVAAQALSRANSDHEAMTGNDDSSPDDDVS